MNEPLATSLKGLFGNQIKTKQKQQCFKSLNWQEAKQSVISLQKKENTPVS